MHVVNGNVLIKREVADESQVRCLPNASTEALCREQFPVRFILPEKESAGGSNVLVIYS